MNTVAAQKQAEKKKIVAAASDWRNMVCRGLHVPFYPGRCGSLIGHTCSTNCYLMQFINYTYKVLAFHPPTSVRHVQGMYRLQKFQAPPLCIGVMKCKIDLWLMPRVYKLYARSLFASTLTVKLLTIRFYLANVSATLWQSLQWPLSFYCVVLLQIRIEHDYSLPCSQPLVREEKREPGTHCSCMH